MRHGKEVVCSFHLACAIFPTVVFVFHGEDVVFMGTKIQIFSILVAFLLVYLRPFLFVRGLHLLAVNTDDCPAGAGLCHN